MRASDLWTFSDDLAVFAAFFPGDAPPWAWVDAIGPALTAAPWPSASRHDLPAGLHVSGQVFLDPTVKLPPYGVIEGPAWIGPECQLRPGVYIRGGVIAGRGCVLGNSCEYKNCLLLDGVESAHFNYIGDSVLGRKAHLGAGVICANLRLDRGPVPVWTLDGRREDSGRRKLGALLGDGAEVGCNSVLQPGVVLGKKTVALSSLSIRGTHAAGVVVRAGS
jgi:NDP-sugar pyrophosphorylase family protein